MLLDITSYGDPAPVYLDPNTGRTIALWSWRWEWQTDEQGNIYWPNLDPPPYDAEA